MSESQHPAPREPERGDLKPFAPSNRLCAWEWLLVLGILLIAAVLRIVRWLDVPPGVIHDEVRNWFNVQLIYAGDIRPLYPHGGGREALYLFIQAASYKLLGLNLLAARFPSVAFGMVGVAAVFSLARRLFGRGAGPVAAAGLATSFWALMFSRLAVRTGSMPVMGLVTVYVYLRFLHRREAPTARLRKGLRPESPVLAGVLLGLTLYTYPSALVLPLILLAWFGYLTLVHREWLRGKWPPLALSFAIAGVMVIPLALAWRDPATAARADEVNAPLEALLAGDPGPTLANVGPVLGVFSVRGDHGLEFNIQDQPIFPTIPVAIFFYVGLAWAVMGLFRAGDERRPGYALALLWLVGMLLPTLVTERPVNPSRTIGLLGIVYVFPAVAFAVARDVALRANRPPIGALVGLIVALGFVTQLDHTARHYFDIWASNPVVTFLYQDSYRAIARDLDRMDDLPPTALGGLTPEGMDPASMRLLMRDDGRAAGLGYFDPQTALLIPYNPALDDSTVFIIVPPEISMHPALLERLPGWDIELLAGGSEAYRLYVLDECRCHVRVGLLGAPAQFFLPEVDPVTVSFLGLEFVGEPGPAFTVLTHWMVTQTGFMRLRFFLHLVDLEGNIVAQSDVLGVPATQWHGGDLIIQVHELAIPPDAVPGPYVLNLGIYNPDDGLRLRDTHGADYVQVPVLTAQ